MFEKALEIKRLAEELEKEKDIISIGYYEGKVNLLVFDIETFISAARENGKKYTREKYEHEVRFTTEKDNIKFIFLADEKQNNYILEQLF